MNKPDDYDDLVAAFYQMQDDRNKLVEEIWKIERSLPIQPHQCGCCAARNGLRAIIEPLNDMVAELKEQLEEKDKIIANLWSTTNA